MPVKENEYCLWCCTSDVPSPFPVKIEKTASVGELKRAIREEKRPELDDIAADSLTLWVVSIPVEELQEAAIRHPNSLAGSTQLKIVTDSLSQVFTGENAPKTCIQVIAQRPSGECAHSMLPQSPDRFRGTQATSS
jgi:hypothetical protein